MIEEQAYVIKIDGECAWVETQRQSACGQCAANKGCGTSVLAKVMGNRRTQVRALNRIAAQVGDQVLIGVEEGAFLRGSVAVYLMPLVTLFLGGLFGQLWMERLQYSSEWPILLGGLGGLAVGFLWLRRFTRRIYQDPRYQPVILKRLAAQPLVGLHTLKS